jgi:hypothetical protein
MLPVVVGAILTAPLAGLIVTAALAVSVLLNVPLVATNTPPFSAVTTYELPSDVSVTVVPDGIAKVAPLALGPINAPLGVLRVITPLVLL